MKSSHPAAQYSLGQYDLYFPDLGSSYRFPFSFDIKHSAVPVAPPVPTASVSKPLHLMFLVLEVVSTSLLYFMQVSFQMLSVKPAPHQINRTILCSLLDSLLVSPLLYFHYPYLPPDVLRIILSPQTTLVGYIKRKTLFFSLSIFRLLHVCYSI